MDWNGLWERYIILCWVGCPWIVLGHPEDQWTGLDYTVLGWMSIDKRINIVNGYWSIIG